MLEGYAQISCCSKLLLCLSCVTANKLVFRLFLVFLMIMLIHAVVGVVTAFLNCSADA